VPFSAAATVTPGVESVTLSGVDEPTSYALLDVGFDGSRSAVPGGLRDPRLPPA